MTTAQQSDMLQHPPAMHDASFVEPHIPQVPEPLVTTLTHAYSHVDQLRHAMVSVNICLVVSNAIYVNYFNTNLFVLYLIGCLPCDR